jgi:hypothetical protein
VRKGGQKRFGPTPIEVDLEAVAAVEGALAVDRADRAGMPISTTSRNRRSQS